MDTGNTEYYAVALMQQRIVYSAKINTARKTRVTATIETESPGSGILQLTIFDARQAPVAERLVFINRHNYAFGTDLQLINKNFYKRARNDLQIDVNDDYEKDPRPEIKDDHTTLYWNPDLYFDKDIRQVTIPVFNSDRCKKMRITIEGINEAGLLTRVEKMIK